MIDKWNKDKITVETNVKNQAFQEVIKNMIKILFICHGKRVGVGA